MSNDLASGLSTLTSAVAGKAAITDGNNSVADSGIVLGTAAGHDVAYFDLSGAAATVQANLDTHTAATGTSVHGLGTASTHSATDFDSAGAAATVNTALNTHIALTGTSVHGLGSASTHPASDFDSAGTAATVQTNLTTHAAATGTVHGAVTTATANQIVQRDASGDVYAVALHSATSGNDSVIGYLRQFLAFGEATIGHKDLASNLYYAFTQNASGQTVFNGHSGVYFRLDNSEVANYTASLYTFDIPIAGTSAVLSGDMTAAVFHGSGASLTSIPESAVTNLTTDLAAKAPTVRTISTTAPLTGGGDLSANRTLGVSVMVASGASHAAGIVPDPGVTSGSTKFLREDASWAVPAGGGGSSQWTTSGSAIYYANPVWINATADDGSGFKLQVAGGISTNIVSAGQRVQTSYITDVYQSISQVYPWLGTNMGFGVINIQSGYVACVIRQAGSQTGDSFQIQNSSGTVLYAITAGGAHDLYGSALYGNDGSGTGGTTWSTDGGAIQTHGGAINLATGNLLFNNGIGTGGGELHLDGGSIYNCNVVAATALSVTGALADGTYSCGSGSITITNGVITAIS